MPNYGEQGRIPANIYHSSATVRGSLGGVWRQAGSRTALFCRGPMRGILGLNLFRSGPIFTTSARHAEWFFGLRCRREATWCGAPRAIPDAPAFRLAPVRSPQL